jgi:hypothetical protein
MSLHLDTFMTAVCLETFINRNDFALVFRAVPATLGFHTRVRQPICIPPSPRQLTGFSFADSGIKSVRVDAANRLSGFPVIFWLVMLAWFVIWSM